MMIKLQMEKNMTMLENKYLTKTKWDGIITE